MKSERPTSDLSNLRQRQRRPHHPQHQFLIHETGQSLSVSPKVPTVSGPAKRSVRLLTLPIDSARENSPETPISAHPTAQFGNSTGAPDPQTQFKSGAALLRAL